MTPDEYKRFVSKKPSKYRNHKTVLGGIFFDSGKEATRFRILSEMERRGEISGLRRQVTFRFGSAGDVLKYVDSHRAVRYIADFVYTDSDGETIVEDVKSPATKTPAYKIKRALMAYFHGIIVREV